MSSNQRPRPPPKFQRKTPKSRGNTPSLSPSKGDTHEPEFPNLERSSGSHSSERIEKPVGAYLKARSYARPQDVHFEADLNEKIPEMTESVNVTKPKKIPSELKLQPESSKNPMKDTTLNFESDKNGTISNRHTQKSQKLGFNGFATNVSSVIPQGDLSMTNQDFFEESSVEKVDDEPNASRLDKVVKSYYEKNQKYLNEAQIDLKTLTQIIYKVKVDECPAVVETTFEKYKPGIDFKHVQRFCQITKSAFQYYKTKASAYRWEAKPLFELSFKDMTSVYRTQIKEQKHGRIKTIQKVPVKNSPKLYYFEIQSKLDSTQKDVKEQLEKTNQTMIKEYMHERTTEVSTTQHNIFDVQQDHLMCYPAHMKIPKKFMCIPPFDPEKIEFEKTLVGSKNINLKSRNKNAVDHRKSIQELRDQKNVLQQTRYIEPNDDDLNGDLSTWSGREKIWYFGEKKLLFASKSDREIELWVALLNIMIELTQKKLL